MDLSRLILDLLAKNNEVSVPNLGKFTYSYLPAEISKITNRINPPGYKLEFSLLEDKNNNTLKDLLLAEYDLHDNKAAEIIDNWVSKVKSTINNEGQYAIKDIGILRKHLSTINFEPDKSSILFAGTFGLEPTNLPLMEIETKQRQEFDEESAKNNGMSKIIKIVIAAAIIILFAAITYILIDSGAFKNAFDNIGNFFKAEKPVYSSDDSDSTEAVEMKRSALLYAEQSDSLNNADYAPGKIAYYIVAGSFKSEANAQKRANLLASKGYNTETINLGDTLFRVSIGTYFNRKKAVEEYIAITNQDPNLKIWMFSRLR